MIYCQLYWQRIGNIAGRTAEKISFYGFSRCGDYSERGDSYENATRLDEDQT